MRKLLISLALFQLALFVLMKEKGITMDNEKLAKQIVQEVGGESNISNLIHCSTRLRFTLVDMDKADKKKLEKMNGIISVVKSGGQFQIIIGNEVGAVYHQIMNQIKLDSNNTSTDKVKQKFKFSSLFDVIASIFTPIIPSLAGAGMLKAFLVLFTSIGLLAKEDSTYQVLNLLADAAFYFIPMLLAVSCANKFKTNTFFAVMIAGVLLHPNFSAWVSEGTPISVFGLPVTLVAYGSSVIPIILTVWLLSYIEKFAEKISPSAIKVFLKPLLVLLITGTIALVVIGPLGVVLGEYLADFIYFMQDKIGWVAVMVMAAFYPFIVMTGMHKVFIPVLVASFVTPGYDMLIIPVTLASNFAQASAALAVSIKSKNKKIKQVATSASLTAYMAGITEPALYGVTLKLKRPMIAAMIGSTAAGLYAGLTQLKSYAYAVPSVFAFPQWISPEASSNLTNAIIAISISSVVTFIMTWILGFDDSEGTKGKDEVTQETATSHSGLSISIKSPINGETVPLSQVNDKAFSTEAMGKGIAVRPIEGNVYAPFDGTVTALAKSKHALGLVSEDGVELLIHIGINTVSLKGKHYTSFVEEGAKIKQGDLIAQFDLQAIKEAGYDVVTPVIVTNTDQYLQIIAPSEEKLVSKQDTIIHVVK